MATLLLSFNHNSRANKKKNYKNGIKYSRSDLHKLWGQKSRYKDFKTGSCNHSNCSNHKKSINFFHFPQNYISFL